MQIIPLSEGSFTIDGTKQFVPFNIDEHDLQKRSAGSLLVDVQPFLVITEKDILLLDTGLGFNAEEGILQLHKNIEDAGFSPTSVTKVLLTHLHKDHAGAVGIKMANEKRSLSFPQAIYYVQEKELDFAFEKGFPSFFTEELEVLKKSSQVILLNENEGLIDNFIEYRHSGGHSPFHQVFWIKEGSEIVFYGGDEAPQYQQMKNRFVAKYDYDGKKAMQLRQEWWEKGQAENWKFLFYHDIKNPLFEAGKKK
ncbi:MAG: MBL fold metallo-hydrolase [Chitinophagaceae bacterium]|nr:MBL fold metallo-hydrolase [Chitinophagaceae bacterium]